MDGSDDDFTTSPASFVGPLLLALPIFSTFPIFPIFELIPLILLFLPVPFLLLQLCCFRCLSTWSRYSCFCSSPPGSASSVSLVITSGSSFLLLPSLPLKLPLLLVYSLLAQSPCFPASAAFAFTSASLLSRVDPSSLHAPSQQRPASLSSAPVFTCYNPSFPSLKTMRFTGSAICLLPSIGHPSRDVSLLIFSPSLHLSALLAPFNLFSTAEAFSEFTGAHT